jgi:hypothetical protein
LDHAVTKNVSYPKDVFPELGLPNPGKADPSHSIVDRQEAATPAKQGIPIANLPEVDNLFDPSSAGIGDDNPSVDGCEINSITAQQAVMGGLQTNIDPLSVVR